MGFISHFLAGGLFNRSEMNKKLDEISDALAPSWKFIDKIDNTKGYSGEWTAPDVFGDGSAYDLGVYMIGGGESGLAHVRQLVLSAGGDSFSSLCQGGASGYGKNAIFKGVVPGTVYQFVIGAGGLGATKSITASGNGTTTRKAGGSTAFGGITVNGGGSINSLEGGQSVDNDGNFSNTHYFGGINYWDAKSQGHHSQNAFDPMMISLARGLSCSGYIYIQSGGNKVTTPKKETATFENPTIGELGTAAVSCVINTSNVTATAKSGTYGNGGGSAIAMQGGSSSKTVTATAGSGGDGVIFLYARKAVTE